MLHGNTEFLSGFFFNISISKQTVLLRHLSCISKKFLTIRRHNNSSARPQKKFKAKMNYADKLGVPYVVFLGDDEIAAGLVACKDMTSGEQTKLPFDATLSRIQEGLSQRNQGKVILEK